MPPPRRFVIAANPTAASGRRPGTGQLVGELLRSAGHDADVLVRGSLAELTDAAAAELARARPDALVVVGGDGMVHAGAQLVAGGDLPLGIVPAGTGNDMARALGIPAGDPEAAVRILLEALDREPRRIDMIRASSGGAHVAWVGGAVSAGFDALVADRASRMRRPRGPSRYSVALVLEIAALRPLAYRLVVDGQPRDFRGVLLCVANNPWLGGGMHITPGALMDDGELDLLFVAPLGRLRFLAVFPKVFRGRHVTLPAVSIERARTVRIESDVPVVAYADGERLAPLPLDLAVVPGALPVLAP